MTLAEFEKKKHKVPDGPGVYFFLGPRKEVLYIGKAASLRGRLRSYFSSDLAVARSPIVVRMVQKARSIDWRETDSVLEALLLEASLIKTHKPPANTEEKDDKSFNYVVFTKEDFPRVLLMRGKELDDKQRDGSRDSKLQNHKIKAVFGPFPHGLQLRDAMKIIRKIFPYRDTCTPCILPKEELCGQSSEKKCKPCFNRQLGLCPGVCTNDISKKEYARTLRHLSLFFNGRKKALIAELARDMKQAAKKERFEQAAEYRRQLFALRHIEDVSLIKDEYRAPFSSASAYRVEAYDVAHFAGRAPVGVMTVVENGVPQKSEYRTFHIKSAKAGDDSGALREILSRRLAHNEWPLPRLIVVDGSAAQMNAVRKVLQESGVQIPLVGVVKNEHHQPRGIVGDSDAARARESDILLANGEAHRFAIQRHRRLLRKESYL